MGVLDWLFGSSARRAKALLAALRAGDPQAFVPLESLRVEALDEVLHRAVKDLLFEEEYAAAELVLDYAKARDPSLLLDHRIELCHREGRIEEAMATLRVAVEVAPKDPRWRASLAQHLADHGDGDEALDLLDEAPAPDSLLYVARAHVLVELGEYAMAGELLDVLIPRLEAGLRGAFEGEWRQIKELFDQACALQEEVSAARGGREASVLQAAARGKLRKEAAVNYTLIGAALMARGRVSPAEVRLRPPVDEDAAWARVDANPRDVRALCHLGITLLRLEEPAQARDRFREAHDLDTTWFPAALGLGAAMRFVDRGVLAGLRDLPEEGALGAIPGLKQLVPDWDALTPSERRVVQASAWPLRSVVSTLAEAGATFRILPLDVRPSDLRELSDLPGIEPHERTPDAAAGLARPEIAVARIEDLLDTVTDHSWVFAHELAHLALWAMPEESQRDVIRLWHAVQEMPWVVGNYQASDPHEFFAVGYEGWLRRRYKRKNAPLRDEEGVADTIDGWFDALAATGAP